MWYFFLFSMTGSIIHYICISSLLLDRMKKKLLVSFLFLIQILKKWDFTILIQIILCQISLYNRNLESTRSFVIHDLFEIQSCLLILLRYGLFFFFFILICQRTEFLLALFWAQLYNLMCLNILYAEKFLHLLKTTCKL